MRSFAFSALSRAISICSADTCLPAPLSLPASSALIQSFSVLELIPRIFATADWLWPFRTMRTASILYSSVYRALGLPIAQSSVAEILHTLSNGYVF
jgi:hypothetical protein